VVSKSYNHAIAMEIFLHFDFGKEERGWVLERESFIMSRKQAIVGI